MSTPRAKQFQARLAMLHDKPRLSAAAPFATVTASIVHDDAMRLNDDHRGTVHPTSALSMVIAGKATPPIRIALSRWKSAGVAVLYEDSAAGRYDPIANLTTPPESTPRPSKSRPRGRSRGLPSSAIWSRI